MARLVGLDIGTSSCKGVLIDESGKVLSQMSLPHSTQSPFPLWTEQRPSDWVENSKQILSILTSEGCDAIGLTGQMHGSVFLDKVGKVVMPAILWNDQRTENEAQKIASIVGTDKYREITLNDSVTGFTAPKLLWARSQRSDLWKKIDKICLPKDYVGFALTGILYSEPSDASGTGLFDCRKQVWSQMIVEELEIPANLLPEIVASDSIVGNFNGIPVVAGGGDQSAGGIGVGAIRHGVLSLCLGSSGVLFLGGVDPFFVHGLNTFCHASGGFLRMAVTLNCATTFHSLLSDYGLPTEHAEWNRFASEHVNMPNWGLIPFLQGERAPVTTSQSRIVEFGNRPERAVELLLGIVQSISTNLWLCEQSLLQSTETTNAPSTLCLTGGLARSPIWRQVIADTFQRPVVTMEADEGPAFGAAILAGVGVKVFRTAEEGVSKCVREHSTTTPKETDRSWFKIAFSEVLWQEFGVTI